jgi:pimeloyl-ACP methyl ester carboxylesterase
MEPQYRFCTSADGTKISFSTLGGGRRTPAITVESWSLVQESAWWLPWVRMVDWTLAEDRCVVRYDRRGVGASQRNVEDLSLEAHVADLRAVAEQLEFERFDLFGGMDGTAVALACAARHPEHVRRLMLWKPSARGADIMDAGVARGLAELIRGNWDLATRAIANTIAFPSGPVEAQREFAKLLRESTSPEVAARYIEFQASVDVSALLPRVIAPTLIFSERESGIVPIRAVRAVAEFLPDARLIVLGGDSPAGSGEKQLEILREFLDEAEEAEAAQPPSGAAATVRLPSDSVHTFAGGRYTVIRLLGEGAQKTVYLVHDAALERDCALALLKTEVLDADGLARVRREGLAMARLTHPNIVTVYDIGEEDGRPYLVCEYVPGGDLRHELDRANGPLPLKRALAIAEDLCSALAFAHSQGIIHRDVKPSNVHVARDGSAKLGDFGLALAADRSRLTMPGTAMGTAAYMAPEQARGQPVDARSDLYSLGCLLYELITGRPPFTGDDPMAVVAQHVHAVPEPPSRHNPQTPRDLEQLVLGLLAKAREERPSSAEKALVELKRIAAAS